MCIFEKNIQRYPRTPEEAHEASESLRKLTIEYFKTPLSNKEYTERAKQIPGSRLNLREAGKKLRIP